MSKQISIGKATFFIIAISLVCSLLALVITHDVVGERKFKAGLEEGTGQLKNALLGEVYELKLVGIRDGKAYEMEASFGRSINGIVEIASLPKLAKKGDDVVYVEKKGFMIMPK